MTNAITPGRISPTVMVKSPTATNRSFSRAINTGWVVLTWLMAIRYPMPSMVSTAASSYGEGKKALAACERWCSGKKISGLPLPPVGPSLASSSLSILRMNSFSRTHTGMAAKKLLKPRGAKAW